MSELEPTNEVTRRQWILILGRLGVIAGFSGVVPEFASVLSAAGGVGNKALPPGLYYPSEDHLSHALSDVGSHKIPPGSETEYVQPVPALSDRSSSPERNLNWLPKLFRSCWAKWTPGLYPK